MTPTVPPPVVEVGGHARLATPLRRIRILGIGMGPQHVTPEVAEALTSVAYVVAAAKSDSDPLLAVRQAVCTAYDVPLVAVPDPVRSAAGGYAEGVADWHVARVAAYADVLDARPGDVGFLVWGDPSLYDSTIRVVSALASSLDVAWDVLPGVSAPSLLAARHRIVLHEVGRPVHITTGRLLPSHFEEALPVGSPPVVEERRRRVSKPPEAHLANLLVMLGSAAALTDLPVSDWRIWWGANLGAPGERLCSGIVSEVLPTLLTLRDEARAADGWVMEVFLLRRGPGTPRPPRDTLR